MKITSENVNEVIRRIQADPSASYWLKDALNAALSRDIVGATNDAEVLAMVLAAKADAVLRGGLI